MMSCFATLYGTGMGVNINPEFLNFMYLTAIWTQLDIARLVSVVEVVNDHTIV